MRSVLRNKYGLLFCLLVASACNDPFRVQTAAPTASPTGVSENLTKNNRPEVAAALAELMRAVPSPAPQRARAQPEAVAQNVIVAATFVAAPRLDAPSLRPNPAPQPLAVFPLFQSSFQSQLFTPSVLKILPVIEHAPFLCKTGSGQVCTASQLGDPAHYPLMAVLPTGFTEGEYATFRQEFDHLIANISENDERLYTTQYKANFLYLGFWLPGGALGSADSTFGGKIAKHPIRGLALTLRQEKVIEVVDTKVGEALSTLGYSVAPQAVMVLFNTRTTEKVTANATPPSVLGKPYGIAKVTLSDLYSSTYVAAHELGHAYSGFLDEYVEAGLEFTSICSLDYLTPFVLLNSSFGSWVAALGDLLNVYDYNVSEILVAGATNIALSPYPATVITQGFQSNLVFANQGGMFFGIGTYDYNQSNYMAGGARFDYALSVPQIRDIESKIHRELGAASPNDRIRNAGPLKDWALGFGSDTRVLLFDSDKHHHFHPTLEYVVQVGWNERHWKTCYKYGIPYPCYDNVWTTQEKTVKPATRVIELKSTELYGMSLLLQRVACTIGITAISSGGGSFDLCGQSLEQVATSFLPTFSFRVPYQEVSVPATQMLTKYNWRFATRNSNYQSGFTGWSTFSRVF
ncbi:hypothetical protein WDW86_06565 [Bdellovibrionota bacterium FG-2]